MKGDETNVKNYFAIPLSSLLWCQAVGQSAKPIKVRVNGVDLHTSSRARRAAHPAPRWAGRFPLVEPSGRALSPHYRVISYSRRYNYPNDNR